MTENAKKRVKMFTSNTKRDFYLSVYTILIRMAPKNLPEPNLSGEWLGRIFNCGPFGTPCF